MKKKGFIITVISVTVLIGCTPVLDRQYMDAGVRNASFNELRRAPEQSKGRLFILGGAIVSAKFVAAGIQIEAVHLPVDSLGYLDEDGRSAGRFLAVAPKEETALDPALLRQGRRITMAGEFVELRDGKIDEMAYTYPVFRIRQLYLWPREAVYVYPYYYDPWFDPLYPYPGYPYHFRGDLWMTYP